MATVEVCVQVGTGSRAGAPMSPAEAAELLRGLHAESITLTATVRSAGDVRELMGMLPAAVECFSHKG